MDYIPKSKPKRRSKRLNEFPYTISKPNQTNEKNYLGEIWFGKTNNILPALWDTCRAKISYNNEHDTDTLLLQFDKTIVVITITTHLDFLKDMLYTRIFAMDFKLDNENVMVLLYLNSVPLKKFNTKIGSILKTAFSIIFNISCDYNGK